MPILAKAQTEPPQFMTVDGRLYDSTTPEEPLLDGSVHFRIQILNPLKTCILYEEQQTTSTLVSNGYFNLRVGSPTSGPDSLKRTTSTIDVGNSMMEVFQNQNAAIAGKTAGGANCSYTPATGDSRYFRYIVTPSTTGTPNTLFPDMTVDSVPQSLVAETLQGMTPDRFVQTNADVTQAKMNTLLGASYGTLTGLIAGSSTLYLRNAATGTVIPNRTTDPVSHVAGQIWYDSDDNEFRYSDGVAIHAISAGGADPTKLPLIGGTMQGAIDMGENDITDTGHITMAAQRSLRLGVFTTAQQATLIATPLIAGHEGTFWYNTTTNKLMFWDGTAEQTVTPVESVHGRTGAVVAVASDYDAVQVDNAPAGTIAATNVQAALDELDSEKVAKSGDTMTGHLNIDNEQELRLSEADGSGANYVALKSPTTLAGNYTLTLPDTAGSANQVLTTDGSGVLSWTSPASAGEVNTASNQGAMGVGVYDAKVGVDIQFRNINAASNKVSVALDGPNKEIDINVDETNFALGSIPNTPAGTIAATNAQAAINELDTEKVATARAINTAAGSGLTGGGDLTADRSLSVDITGATAETTVAAGDEILIYDASATALRKMTRANFVLSEAEVDAMVSDNGYLTAEADTLATVTGRGASTATNITMNTQAQTRYADAAGGEYAAIQAPATIGTNYILTLPDTAGAANQVLTTDGSGVLSWTTPASVGEVNTASNQGAAGVGVYDAKVGVDIQFRNINAASNKVTVALDGPNKEIDINVDETNFALGSIPNTPAGTIAATNAQAAINELDTEKVAKSGDTMTGLLTMDPRSVAAGDTGAIAFKELAASGANTIMLRSPDVLAADYILTLPTTAGSANQVLSTDGNGLLSWTSVGAASIADDSLNFDKFSDSLALDANTDIAVGSYVLAITNDGVGDSLRVNDNGAADTTPFVIDASGNVGIGTTVPDSNLTIERNSTLTADMPSLRVRNSNPTAGDGTTTRNLAGIFMAAGNGTVSGGMVIANESAGFYGNKLFFRTLTHHPIGFGTNGLERMTIHRDGNIGIATTSPGTLLDVAGAITSRPHGTNTGETGQLIMRELAASPGGTDTATIRAPDSITTSYVLTLPDTAGSANQVLSTDGNGLLSWVNQSSFSIADDSLNFDKFSDSLALDANTDIAVGSYVLAITNDGAGNSFRVNDNGAADATPFVIDQSGNVGIGVSSPGAALDIVKTINNSAYANFRDSSMLHVSNGSAVANSSAFVRSEVSGDGYQLGTLFNANENVDFLIQRETTNDNPVTRFIIKESGNVGVGTTVPGTLLDIAGAITSRPHGTNTGETGKLIMRELVAGGTDTVAIRAPDAIGTSYSLTLPTTAGSSGQVLRTDGVGALTWVNSEASITANSLDFTHFADAMTLDASTNITATGTNVLSITNTGTGDSFRVNDQAGDTSPFTIDQSGNVGIGTTTPGQVLDVNGGRSWFSHALASSVVHIVSSLNSDMPNAVLSLSRRRGDSISPAAPLSGRIDMGLEAFTNGDDGVTSEIIWGWESTPTAVAASKDSYLSFSTMLDNAKAEKVRITSNGAFGIGTTVPGTLLDVAGAVTSRPYGTNTGETGQLIMRELAASPGGTDTVAIRAPDSIGTSYSLTLPDTAGSANQVLTTDGSGILSWTSPTGGVTADSLNFTDFSDSMTLDANTDISVGTYVLAITNDGAGNSFRVNDNGAADTTPFVIDAAGQVGIGTSSPGSTLHVTGTSSTKLTIEDPTNTGFTTVLNLRRENSAGVGSGTMGSYLNFEFEGATEGSTIFGARISNRRQGDFAIAVNDGGTLENKLNIDGTYFTIMNSNVGIGTSTPGTLLDVSGAITSRPHGTNSGETGKLIMRELAASPGGTDTVTVRAPDSITTSYVLTLPDTAGAANQVLTTDGNGILSWTSGGAASIADDSLNFDKFADSMALDASTDIAVDNAEVLSITNTGTGDSFRVNDEAGDTTPFVINQSGNVGVGTTSPTTLAGMAMHIHTSTASAHSLLHVTNATTGAANTDGSYIGVDTTDKLVIAQAENSDIQLWTFGSERMRVTGSGNIGIGTTVPGTLLDVAGAITSRPHGTNTGETGKLIMRELAASPGGTDTVAIRAPDSIGTSYSLTLPDTAGSSGQVLQTNGSGILSWVNAASSVSDDSLNFDKFADSMTLDASTDIAVGANILSITNDGVGNSFVVNDNTSADTSPFVIDAGGRVGIGTTAVSANTKLDVNGQIRTSVGSIANGAVDFVSGNIVTTSFDCATDITLANVRRGGSYTVIVTGAGTTQCNFNVAATGDDSATVAYRFQPANGTRIASSHTIYSLMRVGDIIYISWITGFQ